MKLRAKDLKLKDRVRIAKVYNKDDKNKPYLYYEGKVIVSDEDKVGIEFDKFIDGHTCSHKGKDGYCRYFYDRCGDPIGDFMSFQSMTNLERANGNQLEFEF